MSRITGVIYIDFETGTAITEKQFDQFESKMNKLLEEWVMQVDDAASECGFEAEDMHPMLIDYIECDDDE